MLKRRIAHLPVIKKGSLVGIVSDRDLRKAIILKKGAKNKKSPSQLKVSEIMTREVLTVDEEMSVVEAVNIMLRMGIGSLPVMVGGKLKGIVTKDDLLTVFVEMLRVIQSSSTIDVELVDEIEDVAAVFSVLRKHKATVMSYSASPRGKNSHQVCHFRLKLCPVNKIVRDLKKKKVKVLEAYGDD
jgi:acetoin utilization protein AcuB